MELALSPPPEAPTEPASQSIECATLEPIKRPDNSIDWTATRGKYQQAYQDQPKDQLTGASAWQIAYNQLWAQEQERHVLERMRAIDHTANQIEAPGVYIPLTDIGAWAGSSQGDAALVVDEELARSTRCTRLELGAEQYLYYSRGMSGALTGDQVAEFCALGFEDQVATPQQRERLSALVEAAPFCRTSVEGSPSDRRLGDYFSCLGKELRKKGVDP